MGKNVMGRDAFGNSVQAVSSCRIGTTTVLNIGATATGMEVGVDTTLLRVVANDAIGSHIVVGPSASAATTDSVLPGSVVEYFAVRQGDTFGCISATGGDGELFISEIS